MTIPSMVPAEPGSTPGVPAAPPAGAVNPSPPPVTPAPRVPYNPPPPDDDFSAAPRSGGPPPSSPPGTREVVDNPIPYTRHREMVEKAVAEAIKGRDTYYEGQFRQLMQQVGPRRVDPKEAIPSILRAMGYEVPEAEEPQLSRAEIMQLFDRQQQQFGQAFALRAEHDEAQGELARLATERPELFDGDFGNSFREAATHLWGAHEDRPMKQVAQELIKLMDQYYDLRVKQYAEQKGADGKQRPLRTAVPPPRGSTGPPQHDLATAEGQEGALDSLLDELR